jgi:hypothetical protein
MPRTAYSRTLQQFLELDKPDEWANSSYLLESMEPFPVAFAHSPQNSRVWRTKCCDAAQPHLLE